MSNEASQPRKRSRSSSFGSNADLRNPPPPSKPFTLRDYNYYENYSNAIRLEAKSLDQNRMKDDLSTCDQDSVRVESESNSLAYLRLPLPLVHSIHSYLPLRVVLSLRVLSKATFGQFRSTSVFDSVVDIRRVLMRELNEDVAYASNDEDSATARRFSWCRRSEHFFQAMSLTTEVDGDGDGDGNGNGNGDEGRNGDAEPIDLASNYVSFCRYVNGVFPVMIRENRWKNNVHPIQRCAICKSGELNLSLSPFSSSRDYEQGFYPFKIIRDFDQFITENSLNRKSRALTTLDEETLDRLGDTPFKVDGSVAAFTATCASCSFSVSRVYHRCRRCKPVVKEGKKGPYWCRKHCANVDCWNGICCTKHQDDDEEEEEEDNGKPPLCTFCKFSY